MRKVKRLQRSRSESRICQAVKRALRKEFPGIYVRKIHGDLDQEYMLDLVVIWQGRGICLEVKAPGESAKPRQRQEMAEVIRAGGYTAAVTSASEAVQFVKGVALL